MEFFDSSHRVVKQERATDKEQALENFDWSL